MKRLQYLQADSDEEDAITGLESAAMKVGGTVAAYGARTWLQRRRAAFERGASLAELAQAELKSPLQRNKLDNLVQRIGYQVAEQLTPVLVQRFSTLPENEVNAAILAVVDVLDQADLSDDALFEADADPEQLARRLREQFPGRAKASLLSERAGALYELALDQACRHLVQVIRYLPPFQPAALAEVLGRLSSQSEQLDMLLARTPKTSLHAPRGTDQDASFRNEYLRFLTKNLDRLELLGLPGDDQPTLALTVAYLSLSVSSDPVRTRNVRRLNKVRADSWFEQIATPREAEGVPVEAAMAGEFRTLLRGDAGSGKTTLLNWLAVRAARGEFSGSLSDWNGCVPFPIRLRSFASGELPSPEQFVRHCAGTIAELMPAGWAHRQLRAGKAMLLIDGVDEVPASRRRAVKLWLRELVQSFPKTRVVVTARTAAADHRWLADENFATVTLEPMTPESVLSFVGRWHEAANAAGTEYNVAAAERRLRGQLEREHLRELAATPLLCAMLCALNLAHRSELPRNRMDLYAKALAMLLHLRDAERGITGLLSDPEKRVLLRDLAWRLTLANRIELSASDALEHLERKLPGMPNVTGDAKTLLKHLLERSGVIRAPIPGKVDFVHRTFQEYLAADEAIQQHHVETLIGHAHLDTWWETIVMACGHATAKQASQLLNGILNRSEEDRNEARHLRLLAAACLETVQDIDPTVRSRVDAMVEEKLVPPRDLRETGSLAAVGHRVLRYLPDNLSQLSDAKAAATVRTAALTGIADALPLLASYALDPRSDVQLQIEKAWQYFEPERFADSVLAQSPLNKGRIAVHSRRFLPYVTSLQALTSLAVELPYHEPIDDLKLLTGIPSLENLSLFCMRDQNLDLRPLSEHVNLKTLEIRSAKNFANTSALHHLRELRSLTLTPTSPWRSIEFFSQMRNLDSLVVFGLSRLENLAPISHLNLTSLLLEGCKERALENLAPMESVIRLALFYSGEKGEFRAGREGDISMLPESFPSVAHINLSGFEGVDLTPLAKLPIRSIMLQNSNKIDLSPLAQIAHLHSLHILNMSADIDLSPLADLEIELRLDRFTRTRAGLDRLGPGVKIVDWP
ncbi:NACHT domain-containing protein [Saccharopolyspora sp. CA-218241]|uniref:NACHT domain-containing protein n=1 Tax=Saccharopolyspora sp. CA-218241 TaxID=3240027 RepID=UPI003D958CB7